MHTFRKIHRIKPIKCDHDYKIQQMNIYNKQENQNQVKFILKNHKCFVCLLVGFIFITLYYPKAEQMKSNFWHKVTKIYPKKKKIKYTKDNGKT